jgi:hypothetical protein
MLYTERLYAYGNPCLRKILLVRDDMLDCIRTVLSMLTCVPYKLLCTPALRQSSPQKHACVGTIQ